MSNNPTCRFCGAKQTNRGRLKHYGRYRGFECRTWISDEGQHKQSVRCEARAAAIEILNERGVAGLTATLAK